MKSKLKPATVLDLLLTSPQRFGLGHAIRLLGLAKGTDDPLAGGDWDRAVVRICHRLAPKVALHEVDNVRLVEGGRQGDVWYELTTPVLNVVGVTGVTAPDLWRVCSEKELTPLHAVTHRLVAIWYESWRQKWSTSRPSCLAPPYASHGRSAAGLEAYLARTFRLPTHVQEAVPGWTPLVDAHGRLRSLRQDPARACRLILGPLGRTTFECLLPGKSLLGELLTRARAYAGPRPRFQVELILCARDVRAARFDVSLVDRGDVYPGGPAQDVSVLLREDECAVAELEAKRG